MFSLLKLPRGIPVVGNGYEMEVKDARGDTCVDEIRLLQRQDMNPDYIFRVLSGEHCCRLSSLSCILG